MILVHRRSLAVLACLFSFATSLSLVPSSAMKQRKYNFQPLWRTLRGGEQVQSSEESEEIAAPDESASSPATRTPRNLQCAMLPLTTALASFGQLYVQQLGQRPVLTKSLTASFVFGLSDYLAQKIENSKSDNPKMDAVRLLASSLIGLLYFGPAAHYWYEMIFRLLPGTGLLSTMYKACWGQLIFGPSFTCVFFAVSLLQSGDFSIGKWAAKIRNDLPGAWLAGVGYWPLVDLISFSVVPIIWIPLFVNICSLFWTIYLSLVANRK
jgi:protein Mpv17